MARPEPTSPDQAAPAGDSLRWTVHPAATQKTRATLVAAFVGLSAVLAWSLSESIWIGVLAGLWLGFALRAFFLPRTYVLDEQGAVEDGPLQTPRRIAWEQVRRVLRDSHGLFLSERLTDSRLLPQRGLYLRTRDNAPEVRAWIEART